MMYMVTVEVRDNRLVGTPVRKRDGKTEIKNLRPRCGIWWQTYSLEADGEKAAKTEATRKARDQWPIKGLKYSATVRSTERNLV